MITKSQYRVLAIGFMSNYIISKYNTLNWNNMHQIIKSELVIQINDLWQTCAAIWRAVLPLRFGKVIFVYDIIFL